VIETLLDCAKENDQIVKSPGPQVLLRNFGESSLEFELRVWITDVDNRFTVSSELHQMIDQKFREANIEIAFPQRDLHLRSFENSVILESGDAD
jgi:small-conductance mechanosensitive channel